jgi:ClpP class serine protease
MPWAITSEAYNTLLEIAAREKLSAEDTALKLEALAAKMGRPLINTRETYTRGSVAVVPVTGPLFRYANCFGMISGGTSAEELAQDFTTALQNPAVSAIVLDINSPGGQVDGTNEVSKLIASARGAKPIVSYVGGTAQSGAYWIASAADRIVVDETAMLGSIGTVLTGRSKSDDGSSFEIVSSQSPFKRLDASTDIGRAKYQELADSLAQVFIETVAANRGIDPAKVLSDFGQGGTLIGQSAVAAGMADAVGSLEELLADLSSQSGAGPTTYSFGGPAARGRTEMEIKKPAPDGKPLAAENTKCPNCGEDMECSACGKSNATAVAAAVTGERTRIAAILNHAEASGREQLARALAFDTDMTPEAAARVLAIGPKAAATAPNPLAGAMGGVPNPSLGPGGQAPGADDGKVLAKQIASFANGK